MFGRTNIRPVKNGRNTVLSVTDRFRVSRAGLVGPTRSSTAEETADAMRSVPLPIVSPSATLATLTEGDTAHPNFFRTVPSDKLQIQVGVGSFSPSSVCWFDLLSVCTICQSVCLSCLPVCLYILSVCLWVSARLVRRLFAAFICCLSVLSASLFVYPVCLSVCISCLSVGVGSFSPSSVCWFPFAESLFVYPACLSVCISCPSVYPSACLSVSRSFVCISCLPAYLFVDLLLVYISCLSVCLLIETDRQEDR